MRRFLLLLLVCAVSPLLLAADLPKGLDKFQGSWALSALAVEGKDIKDAKAKLTVKDEKYTYVNGDTTNSGIYKVDASKTPMTLDIVCTDGPDKGKTLLAIYQADGDTIKICIAIKGKDRPTALATKADSGTVLETWKKAK
jgi:uncharacterized protein (TIGR03067 family)